MVKHAYLVGVSAAADHNVERIHGKTVVFCDVSGSMHKRWSSYPTKVPYSGSSVFLLVIYQSCLGCCTSTLRGCIVAGFVAATSV